MTVALSPKFLVLYGFIAAALFVHFRGKARHRFTRQLTDHSTFLAPFNCLLYLFSAVPNRPVLDLASFPELKVLQDNWQTIRDEAVALRKEGNIRASDSYDDLGFNSFFKTGWTRFYLTWYGTDLASAQARCPKTLALLDRCPSIHGAMFAALPPGGSLVAHRDPYAGALRYHLGLVTPNDDRCRIYIDGEPYSWRDGEGIVFDETYIHKAMNETDQDRIILFCDLERPMRNGLARGFNRFLSRHVVSLTATKNVPGEHVGAFNRAFKYVYVIRRKAKALKAYNRKLYYAVKYALFGGLAYWVFIA